MINNKYNIGDKVYILNMDKPFAVTAILAFKRKVFYRLNGMDKEVPEELIFATKDDMIDALDENYWSGLNRHISEINNPREHMFETFRRWGEILKRKGKMLAIIDRDGGKENNGNEQ